jgi:hypothetical protein
MALCLVNRCHLNLPLPLLMFELLLHNLRQFHAAATSSSNGGGRPVDTLTGTGDGSFVTPSLAAVALLDPGLCQSMQSVMKLSDKDFKAMVQMELGDDVGGGGGDGGEEEAAAARELLAMGASAAARLEYVRRGVREALGLDAMLPAVRDGFFGLQYGYSQRSNSQRSKGGGGSHQLRQLQQPQLPCHTSLLLALAPPTLQYLVCGPCVTQASEGGGGGGGGGDFNIRDVFRVREDDTLTECPAMRGAFWEVVDGLSPAAKRQFLKFVTGLEQVPERGAETITIELPFMPLSRRDHEELLQVQCWYLAVLQSMQYSIAVLVPGRG